MPDKRIHRGAHPKDAVDFADRYIATLREAVADYSMLLSKGYACRSSLKLVGDRYALTQRQRLAVMRCACSDEQLKQRQQSHRDSSSLAGKRVDIDGYNVLITIEAAFGGAPLFAARDGCLRDLASLHGTYRKVEETLPAMERVADVLQQEGIEDVQWYLDRPVSNSGRLKTLILQMAEQRHLPWDVKLTNNPDVDLIRGDAVVASSDSDVLDKCSEWTNLTRRVISEIPNCRVINLAVVN